MGEAVQEGSEANPERPEFSEVALDGIRQHYLEARRQEGTFFAISEARKVAEALCGALAQHVPSRYTKYSAAELNERITILEKASYKGDLQIPRAVLAALRTLQAYGNYASHFERDGHTEPPRTATTSAMSSLSLLVSWVLDPPRETDVEASLDLRPPPRKPHFFRRWRIARRVKTGAPKFPESRDLGKSTETRLAAVLRVCEQGANLCTEVCRVVLDREAEVDDLGDKRLPELSLLFARLAYERPTRIPPSVARDIDWIVQTRSAVVRAIQVGDVDADEKFLTDLRHRNVAKEVERWFERDYLGQTTFERFAAIWFVLVPLTVWMAAGWAEDCKDAGRDEYRNALIDRYCSDSDARPSEICDDLKAAADSASSSQ